MIDTAVLLVLITMKTGLVLSKSITAPTYADCIAARPAIEAQYRTPKTAKVQSICIGFTP